MHYIIVLLYHSPETLVERIDLLPRNNSLNFEERCKIHLTIYLIYIMHRIHLKVAGNFSPPTTKNNLRRWRQIFYKTMGSSYYSAQVWLTWNTYTFIYFNSQFNLLNSCNPIFIFSIGLQSNSGIANDVPNRNFELYFQPTGTWTL